MALTRKQSILNTKKMWQYIADNDCSKEDAMAALWPGKQILNDCWACEFTKIDIGNWDCRKCPVWDAISSCFLNEYGRWCASLSIRARKQSALSIVKRCNQKLEEYK